MKVRKVVASLLEVVATGVVAVSAYNLGVETMTDVLLWSIFTVMVAQGMLVKGE